MSYSLCSPLSCPQQKHVLTIYDRTATLCTVRCLASNYEKPKACSCSENVVVRLACEADTCTAGFIHSRCAQALLGMQAGCCNKGSGLQLTVRRARAQLGCRRLACYSLQAAKVQARAQEGAPVAIAASSLPRRSYSDSFSLTSICCSSSSCLSRFADGSLASNSSA